MRCYKLLTVLVITIVSVLICVPAFASEEVLSYEDYNYTITDGEITIVEYLGDDKDVIVPAEIDGYPVTVIGESAFEASSIITIDLPNSIKTIEKLAFSNCYELIDFKIPEGVERIEETAFFDCNSIIEITLPVSAKEVDGNAFYGAANLENIYVLEGNEYYGSYDGVLYNNDFTVLVSCPSGKKGTVVVSQGVIEIGDSAFSSCFEITDIVIPDTVTKIGSYAFCFCNSLTDVYYKGSKEEWNAISIGETNYNDTLVNATMHYDYKTAEDYILGSPDGNDEVNAQDALIVLKHGAKIELLDEKLYEVADVNYDGNINSMDALEILKYSAKIIDRFTYKPEEGIRILKDFINENGTTDDEGNKCYEFDMESMIESEMESIDDSLINDLLGEFHMNSSIKYLNDSGKFEYIYEVELLGVNTRIGLIFDHTNSQSCIEMVLTSDYEEIGEFVVKAESEFTNKEVRENTEFTHEVSLVGEVFESWSETDIADYIEVIMPELDMDVHVCLAMLSQMMEEYVSINIKDIGFTNYNISLENYL